MADICLGASYRFVPSASLPDKAINPTPHWHKAVTGTIIYINEAHRFFTVEYRAGTRGVIQHESFKF